jgi:hypothetical protein
VTLDDLVAEYRAVGIGARLLGEVTGIVRAVTRSYDPVVYGGSTSWEEALDDLVQEFGLDVLVGQGQLEYAMTMAVDREHFRRLLARQVRYLLARRRRRTVVDNLIDRARKLVESPPFRVLGERSQWCYTLIDKETTGGRVSEAAARTVASRLAEVPMIRAEPRVRAPAVYSEDSLQRILAEIAHAVPCAVAAGDLDRIFSLLLTSWLPRFLKEGEAAVATAAADGLDAEEQAIVDQTASVIVDGCSAEVLEVLRLKLNGVSDRLIGDRLGLSRPTVSKRKREAMRQLERVLSGLREPLRLAVVDRLGARLDRAGGSSRESR